MNIQRRSVIKLGAGLCVGAAIGRPAWAQAYPSRPVTLVVPFAPGGNTDIVGRTIATALAKVLGQSVVVDNRSGAGGSIGASQVARSDPDGYTLLLCGAGVIVTVPQMVKTSYSRDSFTPLGLVNKSSMVLLVRGNDDRFKSLKDFAEYARAESGRVNAAHSGPGTPNHLALLQTESLLKAQFTVLSYKGANPALISLLGGQIDTMFDQVPSCLPHIKSGALKALAVLGPERDPIIPDVPTIAELGFGNIDGTTYVGILGPSGMPKDLQDKLANLIAQAVKDPQAVKSATELGSVAYSSTPAEFTQVLNAEYAVATQAAKDGRLKVD